MDHSTDDCSSEFESMKKVKHLVESDGDNNTTHHRSAEEVWIKPKSERKSPTESNLFCGRLSVTTTQSGQHLSDGAASSSEMSPGSSSPSRSCTQCGATKTPLWRNGPCGPKSLCNACGIRYKKVGCTKRTFNGGAAGEANNTNNNNNNNEQPASQPAAKPSTKSPKRKAEEVSPATPTERTHHRKSKVVIREANTSYTSNPASINSNSSNTNNNTSNNINNNNSNNNMSSNNNKRSDSSSAVEEKVASMVFRRVAVPRRVCTRRSLPAFQQQQQQQQQSQKWGSRSARLLRKSQSKDEEEEGAALLMALACGLVNA